MSRSLGDLSDDELYALFTERLGGARNGVEEIRPGVLTYPGEKPEDWAEVHITRAQLVPDDPR